jgi:hypothetical protein
VLPHAQEPGAVHGRTGVRVTGGRGEHGIGDVHEARKSVCRRRGRLSCRCSGTPHARALRRLASRESPEI